MKNQISKELETAFLENANSGMEEVSNDDLQMPFIRALQPLNPQLQSDEADYIPDAKAGDIFNTVTKKFWKADDGLLVIPVYYQMKYLEFIPRGQDGGGFVGEINPTDPLIKQAKRDESNIEMLPNGNELIRTAQHYVKILHEDGSLESAVIDLKKTGLKKSRIWNSLMAMQKIKSTGKTMPTFANVYRATTVKEKNDKGTWYSLSFTMEKTVPDIQTFNEAKDFSDALKSGSISLAPPAYEPEKIGTEQEVPF
tara:strand:+ start:100 stop:861 length:762 start_codon:yes stop_codon:yes gene_type:complete